MRNPSRLAASACSRVRTTAVGGTLPSGRCISGIFPSPAVFGAKPRILSSASFSSASRRIAFTCDTGTNAFRVSARVSPGTKTVSPVFSRLRISSLSPAARVRASAAVSPLTVTVFSPSVAVSVSGSPATARSAMLTGTVLLFSALALRICSASVSRATSSPLSARASGRSRRIAVPPVSVSGPA